MSAIISPCGQFRYSLEREVGMTGPVYAFFGVNGSTADGRKDDHTVRKWIGFVKVWGGRRFIVGNVSPVRATDVRELAHIRVSPAVRSTNLAHLQNIIRDADVLVPCWGDRKKAPRSMHNDFDTVLTMLLTSGKPVMHLGLTKGGDPRHPLMLPYTTPLQAWAAGREM